MNEMEFNSWKWKGMYANNSRKQDFLKFRNNLFFLNVHVGLHIYSMHMEMKCVLQDSHLKYF